MSDINTKCLDVFPAWLSSLDEDAGAVLAALSAEGLRGKARAFAVGGLNYTFTSLDLVPDVVADIGYLDDAFVLRLASAAALGDSSALPETVEAPLKKLAEDTEIIKEFLGDDTYRRLDEYTRGLADAAARGRIASEIASDDALFQEFADDVTAFAGEYKAPEFTKDEKSLIKLKAFLEAKLP